MVNIQGRPEDINLPAHLMDGVQMGDEMRDDHLIFGDDMGEYILYRRET